MQDVETNQCSEAFKVITPKNVFQNGESCILKKVV